MTKAKIKKPSKGLPDLTHHDPLIPFNLDQIGSTKDPCFGQAYDLSTKECRMCGDSELCALKMSQSLHTTRKALEDKNQYKDLDTLEDIAGIKKYLRGKIRRKDPKKQVIASACNKFEVPKKIIRKLYRQIVKKNETHN